MEDKKELAHWLLQNKAELELRVERLHWINEWLPGMHDIRVIIYRGGQSFVGRGIADNPDLALTKAGAEAIERAYCLLNGISSCGVAVHTDESLAQLNAKLELIERDLFFCHYLTRTPFYEASDETGYLNRLHEQFRSIEVSFNLMKMRRCDDVFSFIALASGEKSGLVVGLGCSLDKKIAQLKAICECVMNSVAAIEGNVAPMSLNEFSAGEGSPEVHRRLYLGEQGLRVENSWMLEASLGQDKEIQPLQREFQYENLTIADDILSSSPLTAKRCLSENLQKTFFGSTVAERLNLRRLAEFMGTESIDEEDLNFLPHPLG